ncbi:zinc dependent phospholipase C family protein [Desulfosporosinus sp. SB140]|uniref:zinc dependent phospholipase C family protein n=1 Tax=Desulfosporosinus paludis TaxID=3115649 RepID=UPI00388D2B45
MYESIIGQTLGTITKMFLAPVAPLQYFLDSPGLTHGHCLEQAYISLENDGKASVSQMLRPYHPLLSKGLFWADRGWKNVNHFYSHADRRGRIHWPGATAECQFYFNKALYYFPHDIPKSMFFLGAALHLVQDMCVPHHSLGIIFDGHKEFETWATQHCDKFKATKGQYLTFTHTIQWIEHNARISETLFPLVALSKGASESSYLKAAETLIPLTIATTAGFLDFAVNQLESLTR